MSRLISKEQRAVTVKAYRLANELREFLPEIIGELSLVRRLALFDAGERARAGAALEDITAQELATHLWGLVQEAKLSRDQFRGARGQPPLAGAGPAESRRGARLTSAANGGGVEQPASNEL